MEYYIENCRAHTKNALKTNVESSTSDKDKVNKKVAIISRALELEQGVKYGANISGDK